MALAGLERFDLGGVLEKDGAKGHRPAFLDQKAGVVTDVEQLVQGLLLGEGDWAKLAKTSSLFRTFGDASCAGILQ